MQAAPRPTRSARMGIPPHTIQSPPQAAWKQSSIALVSLLAWLAELNGLDKAVEVTKSEPENAPIQQWEPFFGVVPHSHTASNCTL